jgi:DNA-binding transcriptional LysR family regulator
VDASTRKLRYFVAVAEELHFSRAAGRLFVAQQALSKQVKELEDTIGVPLLRRTTRSVELTPAGEVFLDAARDALAVLDSGVEDARRAGRGEVGTLKVGFIVGAALELTAPLLEEFNRRNPRVELEMREFQFGETSAGLAEGWSDVAFLRLPATEGDLEFEVLFTEPLVAALPRNHRLAGHHTVTAEDMVKETLAVGRSEDAVWQRFWALDDHRAGDADRRILSTHSQTEEVEIIAAGAACAVTVAGAVRYLPHPALRYVPIEGVEGCSLAIGWRAGGRTPLVERFLAVATEVRDRETELLARIEHPFDAE